MGYAVAALMMLVAAIENSTKGAEDRGEVPGFAAAAVDRGPSPHPAARVKLRRAKSKSKTSSPRSPDFLKTGRLDQNIFFLIFLSYIFLSFQVVPLDPGNVEIP